MTHAFAAQAAASRSAVQVDAVFIFIAAVSLFFFLLVEGMLVYFAVKYRRRKGEEAAALSDVRSNTLLETVWIVIPSLVVIAFFYYGYVVFRDMRAPRPGAEDINVVARQFFYTFQYPDGRKAVNELRVPEGRPVKLVMISEDVIHGFFIPDYRIKQDILPGQYTTLWLSPDRPGTYDIFCTQYCGVGHSTMRARLVVMPAAEYARWAASGTAEAGVPAAERGKRLLETAGCLGCHTTDGAPKVGPTFKGLYDRKVTLADGRTIEADEGYIRESILDPGAKVVKGFPNVMPTFKGTLSDDDVSAIIAYMKVLAGKAEEGGEEKEGEAEEKGKEAAAPSPGSGRALAQKLGCLGCHSTDGTTKDGPTWKGLYGSRVPLADGRTVVADEAYITESILEPGAKVVKGFPDIMPPYKGAVTDRDVAGIVAYIKTLK